MPMARGLCLALSLALVAAASDSEPHYHRGKLTRYELGPPTITLSASDEARLRTGKAVTQAVETDEAGARRMIMVQNIPAPSSVVMGRIMDFEKYDKMVDGVDSCVNYVSRQEGKTRTVKSTYDISVLHMKFKYFVEHTYDPEQRCMVFNLDYDRRSDLDDSVGYWYVMPTGRAASRVYYSCECKLRGWVPGPVYSLMTKEALKKATTWVSHESIKEYRASQRADPREAVALFVNNLRASAEDASSRLGLKMPQPLLVNNWLSARKAAAVRFVSAARPPFKGSSV